ncbi:MAG: hypothetical protein GY749_42585 [Desulfobacteraceae bacterium]|nr:hypothetical protein [Desulfobacteraceae bacterium]
MAYEDKIDIILQYILCVAGQDDWHSGELGMIHLIKYAYLGDLSYAEYHNAETFIGIPWEFYHYGPWSRAVCMRIEPALANINAQKRVFHSSTYDRDFERWSIKDARLYEELERKIDIVVAGAVQKYVRRFGQDTSGLLHYVYQTLPMLKAAPGELLDFSTVIKDTSHKITVPPENTITARQKKKRKELFAVLKDRLNRRLDRELKKQERQPTPPRYDDVFFEGVRHLDSLAGEPLEPSEYTAVFSDDVWKSKARFDPDVQ